MARGGQFKHQSLPLMRELNECGYSLLNLHLLLKCSKQDILKYFRNSDKMRLSQIKEIALAINKPIGYCVNQLLKTPPKSPNWMSEDYSPEERIAQLKKQ